MITIFAVPKAFINEINIIQRNAILSWRQLIPRPEIILFGDDEGVTEAAREFEVRQVSGILRNEFGTPIISDIFEKAQKIAKNNIMSYINADIILTSDFLKTVALINFPKYLVVGRRWDLDINEEIDFSSFDWEKKLKKQVKENGLLHGPAGIDYFIFPRNLWQNIPPFAIGRTVWDNWLLYKAWVSGAKIIDATARITVIHQNHQYANPQGKIGVWQGKEAKENLKLARGVSHMLTIRDSELVWLDSGLKKPKLTFYRFLSFPFRYFEKYPWLRPILFPGWLAMVFWRKIYRHFFL